MSGTYSMSGSVSVGIERVKKETLPRKVNGPPPLSYSSYPPDDENMNEIIDENVDLMVMLPDGSQQQLSVESNIPMMDLLINLAASNKLNPASHSLVVLTDDKWKQIDFMANKTIGLLAGEDRHVSVQIVQKKTEEKSKMKLVAQPFEMTYRFTVNLPHNQKKVLRISPRQTLGEVRQVICKDKNYDPKGYVFQLPGNPKDSLDDLTLVGDLNSSEINFVSTAMIDAAFSHSLPSLAYAATKAIAGPHDQKVEASAVGDKKAKWGFLSVFSKKDRKFKSAQESEVEDLSRSRLQRTATLNVEPHGYNNVQMRPKSMYVESGELDHFNLNKREDALHVYSEREKFEFRKSTGPSLLPVSKTFVHSVKADISKQEVPTLKRQEVSVVKRQEVLAGKSSVDSLPRKSGKRKAAPPPPQLKSSVPQNVQIDIKVNQKVEQTNMGYFSEVHAPLNKMHSRNSSDSSGYHELTVSGAESPDTSKIANLQTTLDTTSIDSEEHLNGDSGIKDMFPKDRWATKRNTANTGSRDSSLDMDRPKASSVKKKLATIPSPVISDEDFAALKGMEEVTIEESDDESHNGMQMVEDDSLQSEDIDLDLPHQQRDFHEVHFGRDTGIEVAHRCQLPTYPPPPPPTECDPEDAHPVEFIYVVHKESTSDIDDLQTAMSDFQHQMASLSSVGVGCKNMTSCGIRVSKLATECEPSIMIQESAITTKCEIPVHSSITAEGIRESPEINCKFTTDSVPPNFENEDIEEKSNDMEKYHVIRKATKDVECKRKLDLDIQKEHKTLLPFKVEKAYQDLPLKNNKPKDCTAHWKLSVNKYTQNEYLASQKTPVNKSMMHKQILTSKDLPVLTPLNKSTPKDYFSYQEAPINISKTPTESVKKSSQDINVSNPVINKPAEKEEFVISLDELSNVDFSASNYNKQKQQRHSLKDNIPKVNYRIEFRSSLSLGKDDVIESVNQEPVLSEEKKDSSLSDDNIKITCSEISFSPNSEGAVEHVFEDKSTSLSAHQTSQKIDNEGGADSQPIYSSSTTLVLTQPTPMTSPLLSSQRNDASLYKDDSFKLTHQTQYQQMQDKFVAWQQQLIQNQMLLDTSTNQTPEKENQSNFHLQQLQLQIQMQQHMLLQLQQSMQTIAWQNSLVSQQQLSPAQTVTQPIFFTQEPIPPKNIPSTSITILSNNNQTPSSMQDSAQRPQVLMNSKVTIAPVQPTVSKSKSDKADVKHMKTKVKRLEHDLDPREQLMLDIKNIGKSKLKMVPVKATHWYK